jgi:hypothetical protein
VSCSESARCPLERSPDRRVVQCNYAEPTSVAATGARAYLVRPNPGGGDDRIVILVRSRGGRWIEKWENIRRLENFRAKTLPVDHPLYTDERIYDHEAEAMASRLTAARLASGERREYPLADTPPGGGHLEFWRGQQRELAKIYSSLRISPSSRTERLRASGHVIYCCGCGRTWTEDANVEDSDCACTCSDPAAPHYEEWVIDPVDPAPFVATRDATRGDLRDFDPDTREICETLREYLNERIYAGLAPPGLFSEVRTREDGSAAFALGWDGAVFVIEVHRDTGAADS